MRILDIIALCLTIIGGLNWLLVGAFKWDLVAAISNGRETPLARTIYVIVGLCALYSLKFFTLL
ncbi:DUF378 domain-containing protein [Companilactobacillus nuruki]|uniref:DUF378 domain-containing protein n=1 Tax=Companilactobacillus nuruki TaxID=1993540 RepID=A0A2N7ATP5_9LACO|nr:DUF378 domain-containing protein [Companilactobacillus nuruki]PMD69830.1 DUF378 domain-containing protein [Companilactobacillus nuruki]